MIWLPYCNKECTSNLWIGKIIICIYWNLFGSEIIARVIGPDQSFYCLCAQLFSNEDLPKSMSFVLY